MSPEASLFTGLIEACGAIERLESCPPGVRLTVHCDGFFAERLIGDSVSINGCCLTAVECEANRATFDAGDETLRRTNLGTLVPGAPVNLESAICAGKPLGGHWVTGHIDGVGIVLSRSDRGSWSEFWIAVDEALARQMASKGSVAVDGVSLTLCEVCDDRFSVALIPHSLNVTTFGKKRPKDTVNIETDVLAKYVERQLRAAGVIPDGTPRQELQ